MQVECEKIPVHGHAEQNVQLKFTRHGPVIYEDASCGLAYAVRTVWSEPGSSPYFASLNYLDARTTDDFAKALHSWSTPSVNQVYADSSGNIGWFVAGKSPHRSNWDGLLPVPGNGRYEWDGFKSFDDLPRAINPPQGFIATANEFNIPPGHPAFNSNLCVEWNDRSRASRINEVLQSQNRHTLAQSRELQCDLTSIAARRICHVLQRISGTYPEVAQALDLLAQWDHRIAPQSAAAALFEVWWTRHLKPALLDYLAPHSSLLTLLAPGDNETLLALLECPDQEFDPSWVHKRDFLLVSTLTAAMTECREILGGAIERWRWGALHQNTFVHPLGQTAEPGSHSLRDVGPLPVGGSEFDAMLR